MFNPKNDELKQLASKYYHRIEELSRIFDKPTNIYIDFANVFGWQKKLGWHISLKRLKLLLDSFDTIKEVKFYNGTLDGDLKSEQIINEAIKAGYFVITKPVKIMKLSIDVTSIPSDSPAILKDFIRAPLLKKMNIETISYLNARLKELNQQGITHIEDLKCNFDVEIGRDMLIDYAGGKAENFVLWSGDSDFFDPIKQLLEDGRKVVLFATARKVATELNRLTKEGLYIFEINKIRDFICWRKDIKP